MAKDPAFLFYPGDWMGGTMILSRHQKGCYIDLLIAQFNNGPLSLETIKTILGQDQANWTVLAKKFKQDSQGNFFNERLVTEIEKRREFCKSKSHPNAGRKKSADKSVDNHTNNHTEDENENRNKDEIKDKGLLGEKEKILMPFTSEKFRVLWQNWKDYRLQEFKQSFKSGQSEQAALAHLAKISGGSEENAFEIISQSIGNQWKGLFEIKISGNGKNGTATKKVTGAELNKVFAKRYS